MATAKGSRLTEHLIIPGRVENDVKTNHWKLEWRHDGVKPGAWSFHGSRKILDDAIAAMLEGMKDYPKVQWRIRNFKTGEVIPGEALHY